ncbi:hypothetical protein ACWD6P_32015 [Streptomyces sp. NPDC002446]
MAITVIGSLFGLVNPMSEHRSAGDAPRVDHGRICGDIEDAGSITVMGR